MTGYYGQHGPHRPSPVAPPRARRSRAAVITIVVALSVTALMLLVLAGTLLYSALQEDPQPPVPSSQPSASQPNSDPSPSHQEDDPPEGRPVTADELLKELNEHLAQQDRAGFFDHVDAGATDELELWWENMATMGMTSAGISLESGTLPELDPGDEAEVTFRIGALTSGTAQVPDAPGLDDVGDHLPTTGAYDATVSVDDQSTARITQWEPAESGLPWDEGELIAEETEHALLVARADEAELLDIFDGYVDEAVTSLERLYEGAAISDFTIFVTDEESRFRAWLDDDVELAGFFKPLQRLRPSPGLDPEIATADVSPWGSGIVGLGPGSLEYEEETPAIVVHELVHAVDESMIPLAADAVRSRVTIEGWARVIEEIWAHDEFAAPGTWQAGVMDECLAAGYGYPDDELFDGDAQDVQCAYSLSGSVFAYADDIGIDAFDLSYEARRTGDSLIEVSERIGPDPITEEAWQEWVHQRWG